MIGFIDSFTALVNMSGLVDDANVRMIFFFDETYVDLFRHICMIGCCNTFVCLDCFVEMGSYVGFIHINMTYVETYVGFVSYIGLV